jgi:catechol 2,3-dioxygenase-like lactoylglutathione lyase family enzyme
VQDKFQLGEQPIVAFISTSDPDRAKKFYRDTLGLPLIAEELPFAPGVRCARRHAASDDR